MKSLDIDFLNQQAIPIEMGGLLQKLGEYKGRQDLFQPKPKGRSEAEILGYRAALSKIHTKPETFAIDEKTILDLQRQIYARTDIPCGQWKKRDNTIEERLSDARWITKFVPVSTQETPLYIKELCSRLNRLLDKRQVSLLVLIPAFVFDFL